MKTADGAMVDINILDSRGFNILQRKLFWRTKQPLHLLPLLIPWNVYGISGLLKPLLQKVILASCCLESSTIIYPSGLLKRTSLFPRLCAMPTLMKEQEIFFGFSFPLSHWTTLGNST
ncbi:hypothetical protein AVEN_251589-1 [Araneus ventricosus]|uniref:Uncharacterized protein n=1 Tax=Araneus ventricosus TaxID=182803 RepID=A0A4Y2N4D3_ARAVE|nr:hypothetical protein AVEN_7600-1 [Araneus ventricosus]GBN33055.1 hypothetical protein AVEN_251589-1 [Araneus ventricosus]